MELIRSAMLYLIGILLLGSPMRDSCVLLADLSLKHTCLSLLLIGFATTTFFLGRCVLKGTN